MRPGTIRPEMGGRRPQGGRRYVRTGQSRIWPLSGSAAQGKGDDPEGACRDAVRVRQGRQQVGTGSFP